VRVERLRVALFTDNGVRTPTPETQDAVTAAGRALASAGAMVGDAMPPDLPAVEEAYDALVGADGYAWLKRLINGAGTPGMGSYETRPWFTAGRALSGDELSALVEHVDALRSRMLRWLADWDVIVCPAMPLPAVVHGAGLAPDFGDGYSDVHNITGWPSAVVRGGTAPGGLPIGVQVVAGPWQEHLALACAAVVETASGGWVRPPR
jgi:amidase